MRHNCPYELLCRRYCFGHRFMWTPLRAEFIVPVAHRREPASTAVSTLPWLIASYQTLILGIFRRATMFVISINSMGNTTLIPSTWFCWSLNGRVVISRTTCLLIRWQWLPLRCYHLWTRTHLFQHQSCPSWTKSKDSVHWWASVTFGLFYIALAKSSNNSIF